MASPASANASNATILVMSTSTTMVQYNCDVKPSISSTKGTCVVAYILTYNYLLLKYVEFIQIYDVELPTHRISLTSETSVT